MAAAVTEALPSFSELLGPLKPLNDPIPNHLTETRIFTHVRDDHHVKAKPRAIHFEGYRVGKLHQQTLTLVNGSTDSLSLHVIPPTTNFFKISYSKERSKIMPGFSLVINVQFKPDQWKYYYDCIRIHCKGNENLLIPIHGYPTMNTSQFPHSVTFQSTPIGQTKTRLLSLESDIPVNFEYELTYEQTHPAFAVAPMKGCVTGNGKAVIKVTFTPSEFATAIMKLKLEISQFNSKPLFCTFTGTSTPGLAAEQYKTNQKIKATSTKTTPTTKRESKRRVTPKKGHSDSQQVYEGVQFPPNLYTPSAVAKVLAQEPGKMTASQLRKAKSGGHTSIGRSDSKQLKEAVFLQRVKERADAEAKNRLRWVQHIGDDVMSDVLKEEVLKSREQSQNLYRIKCHIADVDTGSEQTNTIYSNTRTRRNRVQIKEKKAPPPLFDLLSNSPWDTRHRANQRFINAIRTVIVRNRCNKRLKELGELVQAIRNGVDVATTNGNKHTNSLPLEKLTFSLSSLKPCVLPPYKDSSTASCFNLNTPIPTKPMNVVDSQPQISLMELKVPLQYKLLGYNKLLVPSKDTFTLPDTDSRPLLEGAKDEYQGLTPIPGVDPGLLSGCCDESTQVESDVVLEDMEVTRNVHLIPPPSMFTAPSLPHKMHNPSPDVIDGLRPMIPNSEVTFEHVLLPLPSPTLAPHPQPLIDQEDGISGLMKWKQFSSPFLSCYDEQTSFLSSWKPILSDNFLSDVLPSMPHPHQLTGPQKDDLVDDSIEDAPVATEEMLKKEFYFPSTEGLSLCKRMEKEDLYLQCHKHSLNEVGKQHEERYNHFNSMITKR